MKKPTILLILDGFGYSPNKIGNAIFSANTPNIDGLLAQYPNALIGSSGLDVGLPNGQMGNSEVGHLNIGAGRIVYQDFTRISKSINEKTFFNNAAFLKAIENAKKHNTALHLFGLLSDGGVHSHIQHLYALLDLLKSNELYKVFLHIFLDGRDVPPKSALDYIKNLKTYMKNKKIGEIATISGRYYAMDRDKRWDRVEAAYNAMVFGKGYKASSAEEAIINAYERGETDEFVKPTVIIKNQKAVKMIAENDSIIMFNFRPDRAREITRSFTDKLFNEFKRRQGHFPVFYVCMTQYDATMPNVSLAYPPQKLKNTLGEYVAGLGLKQLRIAETEKYAHVTFFLNGGIEEPNKNEDRILIPSPKVATYDLKPEMSAFEVTDKVIEVIRKNQYDLIILNYANADMVGHTGIMKAAVQAVETVDKCIGRIVEAVRNRDGDLIITADHGNADLMKDKYGNPVTAHSLNKVPFILVSNESYPLSNGILADIAPTLLDVMGLEIPEEMTGRSLLQKKPALAKV